MDLIKTFRITKSIHDYDASFGIEWDPKRLADLDFAEDISALKEALYRI